MGKLAFLFPGQGAQYIGMGKQIADEYKSADAIFDEASEVLGFDMKKMIFEGDEETLKITENTQPAILTTSVALLQPVLEKGIKPDVVAGLSLGEYSAHVAAGTMTFRDAVALVRKRGKFMQEAVPVGVGTMAAIIGLDSEAVKECCKKASSEGIVEPANFNCPGQITVAGEVKAVEKALEIAKEMGAKRAMLLAVSAPFHCSMLKPAGDKLAAELERVTLGDMQIPVVTNVTAEYIIDKDKVKDLLIRQVSSSVLFEDSIRNMIEDGVDTFVEIGPGKVLSGFVKKINKEMKTLNVEDIESLNKTLQELGA
ncbi:MAG TPA: [acyl-carrier-protein] S-malonyltransferase [Hungateiclostridium thermocellum]|jgi:[acyl-carrier-protein] S-malonyltransferase|uniref:Malonyl CoA-acyl carrier protein transacylase n=2 Tax=Acetivibrio thermocellus TaxID=1515 RepID=A3DDZ0_ACET2|nr:ACP S-malonyltransferase [Acetivibrio thermocellus]CDG35628.1 Malonyl CoA-acyl carrier protein transacylase [Acetivibrio thermocellus BC1]ABN52169.1 malonyl CoA-acyl carrier protein transacylase [Acetivibrio thermocellus ATCC 27405]ADU74345.1 malonyl CoA-acyl carrier protein transacylase [Acetivibrio thermocellus DSM 1313]ALX08289.1 malonyl CoA-acyl carrier protein transacylase [Acetivibrio thermocellus AD2]ANV76037.1 malonyl CoA-acyl carrier protein transacylase [Acetivibrio thermocellus D